MSLDYKFDDDYYIAMQRLATEYNLNYGEQYLLHKACTIFALAMQQAELLEVLTNSFVNEHLLTERMKEPYQQLKRIIKPN